MPARHLPCAHHRARVRPNTQTHVAGLIGGRGTPDGLFQGVAPGVSFIVLKVLDANGYGRTSDVISAIEYAI